MSPKFRPSSQLADNTNNFDTFRSTTDSNHELKNKNPTEAFKIAMQNEEINLSKLIEKISINNLNSFLFCFFRFKSNKRGKPYYYGRCSFKIIKSNDKRNKCYYNYYFY